ncbi:putative beta-lysine N-acetyltransferase [Pseudalkalibacillus berkeleyi]|uniref:Beta-lysine N-acetyltransferase n=1 Tax=Pseudalkalibacillus berkeleyi TaxID=1069813 RepID=A0ABS9GZZ4_9BACL|nr:putative beta-lysine N-acetyltransferase [Pseudalkalibacillus berkeleyi]MCF6137265.1 putative beta-lysine N-acetyltransferase [Pseudalkalibacillus berkeleyi]
MRDIKVYYEDRVVTSTNCTMNVSLDFFNERLKIEDYRGNIHSVHKQVTKLLAENPFTKVIIKSRQEDWKTLLSYGYQFEALYSGYFNGSDAYSMAHFTENGRRSSEYWVYENETLQQVQELERTLVVPSSNGYTIRQAQTKDAEELAKLYELVFEIYPTPMNDPNYIRKLITQDSIFYVAECKGSIVSTASADINTTYNNAELTDCATLPEHRKKGLMKILIAKLEVALKEKQVYCAYSIARALSFGMNAVFHQRHYEYKGRFTKNCNIFNKLEDMNLWVCDLSRR